MSKAITLWIPDFLNKQRIQEADQAWSELKLPALKTLLKKADLFPTQSVLTNKTKDFYATASNLFHQPQALPVAASMAASFLDDFDANEFWIKIDPIQMIPDRDTLVLIPAADLNIQEEEAKALITAFNQHFEQDKVAIEYGSPTDWFLRIKQVVDIHTTPLDQVKYGHLDDRYPTGHAAQYWRQLLNEASMLFFSHEVNEERRNKGLPEINGVWLWGEGQLDQSNILQRQSATIWSDNAYLKGLAKLTGSQNSTFPETYQACLDSNSEQHLLMPTILHQNLANLTLEQWLESVKWLEEEWLQPLLKGLKNKEVHSLLLELGDGYRYHIEPKHLKRFWRFKNRI
ncbi:MAG: hypothetical protein U9R28_01930 [Pseudomonadota bacterium]|nr:hypothetical protein [Pseudomonadota bacterium]